LEAIASEKAGIIKPGRPVVLGPMTEVALNVMRNKAKSVGAPSVLAHVKWQDLFSECPLKGNYQQQNFASVGTAINELRKLGYLITDEHIRSGAQQVVQLTGLQGRWQILHEQPYVVTDVAHNEDGIFHVLKQIEGSRFDTLHFVLGMVADKDVSRVLNILPKNAIYYFCKANIPRAMAADRLAEEALVYNLVGHSYNSVGEAYAAAMARASKKDMVFVGGSVFTVAEVI